MDAESLYTLAKKYHFDEICLKILRNCNYTDETVILTHWKNIIDGITHSDNYNRMEVVRTKVITLAKEFNTDCIQYLSILHRQILLASSLFLIYMKLFCLLVLQKCVLLLLYINGLLVALFNVVLVMNSLLRLALI